VVFQLAHVVEPTEHLRQGCSVLLA
jgi:hypothetical protein